MTVLGRLLPILAALVAFLAAPAAGAASPARPAALHALHHAALHGTGDVPADPAERETLCRLLCTAVPVLPVAGSAEPGPPARLPLPRPDRASLPGGLGSPPPWHPPRAPARA